MLSKTADDACVRQFVASRPSARAGSASSVRWRTDWVEPGNVYFSLGGHTADGLHIYLRIYLRIKGGQRHQAHQILASEFLPVCASRPALQWRPP